MTQVSCIPPKWDVQLIQSHFSLITEAVIKGKCDCISALMHTGCTSVLYKLSVFTFVLVHSYLYDLYVDNYVYFIHVLYS